MQISVTFLPMTAAPSNVKKREIHKGGYPASKIEFFAPGRLARGFFVAGLPVEPAKPAKYNPPAMRVRGVSYTKKITFPV